MVLKRSFGRRKTDIHDFIAEREEACVAKRFREEVGQVLVRVHMYGTTIRPISTIAPG